MSMAERSRIPDPFWSQPVDERPQCEDVSTRKLKNTTPFVVVVDCRSRLPDAGVERLRG
jgi:hypothetical protein